MKFLSIIIFLLFPSIVFGGVGDVYYCTGKNFVRIENFEVTEYKPQNFKFKRSENTINFGSDGNYLSNIILDKEVFNIGELFDYGDGSSQIMKYDNGKFHFSLVTYDSITIITGACSIF